jgi:hypothetical protein
MDNGITDTPEQVLDQYISQDLVTLMKNSEPYIQILYYRRIVKMIQELETPPDWIVIADLDEFWFSSTHSTISKALLEVPDSIDIVYCNWKEFGPSLDGFHPASLRKELVYRNPQQTSPKYCFRTCKVNADTLNCHDASNDLDKERAIRNPEYLTLHHYYCQSEQYWNSVKVPRGYALGDLTVYGSLFYNEFEKRGAKVCTLLDTTLADLLEKSDEKVI